MHFLGWCSVKLAIAEFQQRIQESGGLLFLFAATAEDTFQAFCLQVGGDWIPHQATGHPVASSFSAQSSLPAAGLAFLMEKIRNDWTPVKQTQLSGSEVGCGRALTAK